jgi:hypothetical protein
MTEKEYKDLRDQVEALRWEVSISKVIVKKLMFVK